MLRVATERLLQDPRLRMLLVTLIVGLSVVPAAAMPAQSPAATDSATQVRVARKLLSQLVGSWSFVWRSGDRTGFTGSRSYRMLADSLRVVWEEEFDSPSQSGHGVLWYHPRLQKFMAFDVVAPSNEASLLSGSLQAGDSAIVFDLVSIDGDTVPVNRGMVRSRLIVPRSGPHTWARWDNGWIVTFTMP